MTWSPDDSNLRWLRTVPKTLVSTEVLAMEGVAVCTPPWSGFKGKERKRKASFSSTTSNIKKKMKRAVNCLLITVVELGWSTWSPKTIHWSFIKNERKKVHHIVSCLLGRSSNFPHISPHSEPHLGKGAGWPDREEGLGERCAKGGVPIPCREGRGGRQISKQ